MHSLSRIRPNRFLALAASALVVCGGLIVSLDASAGTAAAAPAKTSIVPAPVFSPTLKLVGTVNLTSIGPPPVAEGPAAGSSSSWRTVDDKAIEHHPAESSSGEPTVTPLSISSTQVTGERGFQGLSGPSQATANGGLDLEPPDQGLCAGDGYVAEFINNAMTVYQPNGDQVLSVIPSYELFLQSSTAFFSDPRCYYDASTGHWFFIEFIVGNVNAAGKATSPSEEFIDVSDTPDPLAGYHVWSFDTTDSSTSGCPCFGDYDELGADDSGIYITTDEYPIVGNGYVGVIMYAVSKELLEDYSSTGILPTMFGYRISKDFFGSPYILAPTTTPQGASFSKDTEYFVESNANANADDRLALYALHDTSNLAAPAAPKLYRTEVASEPYAFPPDAKQKAGPRPLGKSLQEPAGGIQADFDSVMETTYFNGRVYAELDTATTSGDDAVAWFQLAPKLSGKTLVATVPKQGYVGASGASLLYPYTALDQDGRGYLVFSLSGKANYPSAAYISYGPSGPSGPVRVAAAGTAPEDGFTCYAEFVGPSYGGCRWGDYSMGVASAGRVYLAAEMVPGASRDYLTNWGTYIWSAPPG